MSILEGINSSHHLALDQFESLLKEGANVGASEISLSTGLPVLAAKKTGYGYLTKRRLHTDEIEDILTRIYAPEAITHLNGGKPLDFGYELIAGGSSQRFRINVTSARKSNRHGIDMTCRLIESTPPLLADIGLDEDIYSLYDQEAGINIISGPTGSGKTTTQAALRRRMLEGPSHEQKENWAFKMRKIVEYASPIEYVFEGLNWRQGYLIQSEVGRDIGSFGEAASNAMRRFAQVIEFTETRDADTALQIPNIGATGHLFSTSFHGSSVGNTLARFILLFPTLDREAAAQSLLAEMNMIICQRLYRLQNGGVTALREIISLSGDIKKHLQGRPMDKWGAELDSLNREEHNDFETGLRKMVDDGLLPERVLKHG